MKPFRFFSMALLACALGCSTATGPSSPNTPKDSPPPADADIGTSQPITLSQRAQSATEGLLVGGIVGSQAGPIGALVVGGLGMIYGAVVGEPPLQSGKNSKRDKSESRREEEIEDQIGSDKTKHAALEDAIQEELKKQEELLRQIEIEEADQTNTEAATIAATTPNTNTQSNPRVAPSVPQERELALALFEEKQVTIPKGKWDNTKEIRVLRYTIDADHDQNPEEIRYLDLATGKLLRIEKDQNYDGKMDSFSIYQESQLAQRMLDTNDDGKIDAWERYTDQRMTYREIDRNFDGVTDAFYIYQGDSLREERHDTDNDGKVDRLLFYEKRELVRTEEDLNHDGIFDAWTSYQTAAGQEFVARIERDKNGNGTRDLFETYAFDGKQAVLAKREEDSNGDDKIDITSFYEKGKLVRREVADPSLVPL